LANDARPSLSRRLLDTARRSEDFLLASIEHILHASDLLDRTLHADVVVDTDIDPGLRRFRADPGQLHLALLKLCKNASDAMLYGGAISISARNVYSCTHGPIAGLSRLPWQIKERECRPT
jgi:nitrogen-specific signal transduction histidine kinase